MVRYTKSVLLIAALVLLLVPASAFASFTSELVPTAPVIDGEMDAVWAQATPVSLTPNLANQGTDITANVRSVWANDNALYFFVTVVGDELENGNPDGPWRSDSTEIGFTVPLEEPGTARRVKFFTYQIDGESGVYWEAPNYLGWFEGTDVVTHVTKATEDGWVAEIKVDLNHDVMGSLETVKYDTILLAFRLNRRIEGTEHIWFDYPYTNKGNAIDKPDWHTAVALVDKN